MTAQTASIPFGASWYMQLLTRFLKTAPLATVVVLVCSLLSQAFLLLAFFLPLKVILLVGSHNVPGYFPESWSRLQKDELVIILATFAAISFLLYQLAEFLISRFSEKGAMSVLLSCNKMPLFEQQNELALKAYHQYVRAVSGLVFCLSVVVLLIFIYPKLSVLLALIGGATTSLLVSLRWRAFKKNDIIQGSVSTGEALTDWLAGVGFLSAFALIIFDLMANESVSIPICVIGLLLARQFFQKYLQVINDVNYIAINASKINAIFQHHFSGSPDSNRDDIFWSLIQEARLKQLTKNALSDALNSEQIVNSLVLMPIDMAPVIPVIVNASPVGKEHDSVYYFIRIYNAGRRVAATHEATLLSESFAKLLPSPSFVGVFGSGAVNCNVFQLNSVPSSLKPASQSSRYDVLARMLTIEPPKALAERYFRSRPMLPQRLSDELEKRLQNLASTSLSGDVIRQFTGSIGVFRSILSGLPMQLVNPDFATGLFQSAAAKELFCFAWHRWSIEPVGCGWPVDEKGLCALDTAISGAQVQRKALRKVALAHVELAAILYEVERRLVRHQYNSAVPLMSSAVVRLAAISSAND